MAPSFDWWGKDTHRGTPVVVKMENPNWSMVELEGPSEDDFLIAGDSPATRTREKARGKNAKQLTWVLLLKAHKAAGCLTSIGSAMVDLAAAVRRRVASGRTDADDADNDVSVGGRVKENPTVKTRFYSCIKVFLWLSVLLLGFEIAAFFKGWHFDTPKLHLDYLWASQWGFKGVFDWIYAQWVLIRVGYLAPPLQFLANACIILFIIQSLDRLILCLGCFWIRFKKIQPVLKPGDLDLESAEKGYFPMVLVQIPMCNEKEVYQQSIAAICNLDWPRTKLLIQVLDDSDDPTTQLLIQEEVHKWQQEGANIVYRHRIIRDGYKAGNLKSAMNCSYVKDYEFVAIFDADFQPTPDFLKRTVPHFKDNEELGLVQARWSFVNKDENLLTRLQNVNLAFHFEVEQQVNSVFLNFFGFNGTAGVWRIKALEDAGGWLEIGVPPMKNETAVEEPKVKQEENGRVKAEAVANGVKIEEKIKKQEVEQVQVAPAASGDEKVAIRNVKRDVKKDEEIKQQEQQEDRSHIRRKAVSCESALWDSIEWVVAAGAEVDAGQRLGTAGRLEQGNQRPMQAPCKGRLYILTKEQSDELMDGKKEATGNAMRIVAFVEYCIHPVRNGRTCLMCLAVVDEEEDEDMESVNVVSHGQVIRLNVEEAKKFDSDNIRRQLGAKKLSLVLDLDHTLLHAVRVDDVLGEITKSDDIYFFFIPGLAQQHVVKLRPGLTEFLTELSALYDLFIYTHGTRLYAEQIVKIIDPEETYFKNRIVARTDTPDMLHKSLKLLFPSCDDSMILVLDDRIDVWKENEGNVFLIEPYHYFKCSSEINNASGRGVTGMEDSDAESSEDRHLAQSTVVLKHVHEAFYAGHETGMRGTTAEEQMAGNGRDVKAILSEQKRAIMHDCRIVFSGVFPIIGPQSHESHYLWRLAIDLGATPSMTLKDFPLTHLVIHPERLGTQKHVQAKKIPGVFIVTPDWILKCARSWSRVSEQDFLADEWKAKQTKKEPERLKEEPHVSADATIETSSASPASSQEGVDGATAPEAKAVPGILLKRETGAAKVGKQVSFATVIDDSGKPPSEGGSTQKSKMVRRSRVIRRPSGSSRARSIDTGAVATGVVATGGTFDFLSKIKATKRETPRTSTKAKKVDETKTVRVASAPKDIDDAFMRLMEAEEREHEQEEKRKQSSTDVKDQLFFRRVKKDGKRSPESNPTAAKRVRLSEEANKDAEDDELDDLEADILGDL